MNKIKQLIKLFGKKATVKEIQARVNSVEFMDGMLFALGLKKEVK